MSASAEFQKLIIDTLKADAGVAALVGAHIYDEPPTSRQSLYVAIGPNDYRPDEIDGITAREETMQIDVFNREGQKLVNTRRTVDACVSALLAATLTLPAPYALAEFHIELVRVFREPDGTGSRGVVQVTALIETQTA